MTLLSLLLASAFAASPTPAPVWHLTNQQEMCQYNLNTKVAKCEKGVTAEQVATKMFVELANLNDSCNAKIAELSKPVKKK